MERIDHIYIVQISSGCLICQIDRMLQRDIPDRESLKFGIAGTDPALMFMIELGKTHCHFSASRSGSSYHNKRSGSFNVLVFAVSFIADDHRGIAWIAGDVVMNKYTDAKLFQSVFEKICAFLSCIAGDADTSHIKTSFCKNLDQTEDILVIGDSQIPADFVFINISCTDHDHDLCLVAELHQHTELAVRFKTRENSGSMIIIKKLAAEFQIKLVIKLADSFTDMF